MKAIIKLLIILTTFVFPAFATDGVGLELSDDDFDSLRPACRYELHVPLVSCSVEDGQGRI